MESLFGDDPKIIKHRKYYRIILVFYHYIVLAKKIFCIIILWGVSMASTLVQIRVDEKLKDDVTAVYEQLGLDLSTAVRIFFKRSVAENGIPFNMKLENTKQTLIKKEIPPDILSAMQSMSKSAAIYGVSEMSIEEINNEIDAARKGK